MLSMLYEKMAIVTQNVASATKKTSVEKRRNSGKNAKRQNIWQIENMVRMVSYYVMTHGKMKSIKI